MMADHAKSPIFARQEATICLTSNDVQTYFDSRYFCPVDDRLVLGRLKYLGQIKGRSQRLRAGHG